MLWGHPGHNEKRPTFQPAVHVSVSSFVVILFSCGATAVGSPANVAISCVSRLKGRAAGEIDPLEVEHAAFPLHMLPNAVAAALDTGVAKSLHGFSSSFFLSVVCRP